MPVLYRKYRPQTFNAVVGQQPIVRTLRNAVAQGNPAHAYLFTGGRGVGKTSVARIFARAINCTNLKDGEACLKCDICQQLNAGTFLDLIEIDAASNTGVDNIRELIEHVRFTPSKGKYKVFIIDEVHMLSKGAFNALLKTLEEPPAHAIFILATTEAHKVPLTIISRTQRFDFQRLSEPDISAHLAEVVKQEGWKYDSDSLGMVAHRAEGSLRDALSLLDRLSALGSAPDREALEQMLGLTDARISRELIDAIIAKTPERLPELFDAWLAAGIDFAVFNRNLLEHLRSLLMLKLGGKASEDIQRQANQLSMGQVMHLIRLFLRAYKELAHAPSPDLPLLLASIEASYKISGAALEVSAPSAAPADAPRPQRRAAPLPASPEMPVDTKVSEAQVKKHWPATIEEIKKINSPLATLVKNSPMVEVKDGVVTLEVRYLFHKEHLESAKQRTIITDAISAAMGKRLGVAARLAKTDPVSDGDTLNVLTDALRVFGGELVE